MVMDEEMEVHDETDSLYEDIDLSRGGLNPRSTPGIQTLLSDGLLFLSQYGWYLLLGVAVLYLLWSRLAGPRLRSWWTHREERTSYDPAMEERKFEEMMKARERMQRVNEARAEEHRERMEKKKSEELQEKVDQWEHFQVVTKKKKRPVGRDYLPLSGTGGGGGGYRPQRRTVSRGGGG